MTEDPRSGPYTVFADDHLGSWVFHILDDLRRMDSEVAALFKVLTAAGMVISPSKSKLILKIKGAAALKFARSRQVKKNGIWHWNFQTDGNTFLIPIEEEVTYLGTILTFGRQADRTVEQRRRAGESASSSDAYAAARSWAPAHGSKSGDHV